MSDATKGGRTASGATARTDQVTGEVTTAAEDARAVTSPLKRAARRLGEAGSQAASKVSELRPTPGSGATAEGSERVIASNPSTSAQAASRRTRKARLRVARVDPWSVFKTALLFAVAGAIIFFIATWVVWGVINASGVFDSVNKAVQSVVASPGATNAFRLEDYVNTHRVLGLTALIGAVDAVLFTALATLFSFLYNLAASVMGGLEVTLAED